MKTITKRDLNQQTARVLASVNGAEPLLVTERGVVRWRIEAVTASFDPVERLRAQARIHDPVGESSPWPEDEPRYTPAEVDAIFADSRGDR